VLGNTGVAEGNRAVKCARLEEQDRAREQVLQSKSRRQQRNNCVLEGRD